MIKNINVGDYCSCGQDMNKSKNNIGYQTQNMLICHHGVNFIHTSYIHIYLVKSQILDSQYLEPNK